MCGTWVLQDAEPDASRGIPIGERRGAELVDLETLQVKDDHKVVGREMEAATHTTAEPGHKERHTPIEPKGWRLVGRVILFL